MLMKTRGDEQGKERTVGSVVKCVTIQRMWSGVQGRYMECKVSVSGKQNKINLQNIYFEVETLLRSTYSMATIYFISYVCA